MEENIKLYDVVVFTPASENATKDGQVGEVHFDKRVSARNERHALMVAICEMIKSGVTPLPSMEVSAKPFRPTGA